jgi:hypothetical protein
VVLSFRHLGCHFLKPDEFANISISKILQFVESEGPLNAYATDSTKRKQQPRCKIYCHAHLIYSSLFYSILFHSARLSSALLYCTVVYWTVLYCTLFYSTPLYSAVLCCALLYSTLLYCTVLNSTLLYSILLHSTLLCCALLCCTVLYSTIRYSTLLSSTLLYYTIHSATSSTRHAVSQLCFNCILLVQWEINLLVGVSGSAGYHIYHRILYILLSTCFWTPWYYVHAHLCPDLRSAVVCGRYKFIFPVHIKGQWNYLSQRKISFCEWLKWMVLNLTELCFSVKIIASRTKELTKMNRNIFNSEYNCQLTWVINI